MFKLAIFDLDGTLFNTTRAMAYCGNFALETLGLPTFEPADYGNFSGGGIEGYVHAVLDAAGDREHRCFEPFWELYLKRQETLSQDANEPYEGICEALDQLKAKGCRLAVLSNKDHATCVEIVEGIFGKGYFDVIRGDRQTIPVKPDPAGVYAVLEEAGVSSEECFYVGDTEVDMETGKNAKIFTVAALWGYRKKEILLAYKPDAALSSPSELMDLLP